MTVLDLSNYDADTLDVACMKANGVTGVILGCQRPQVAREMAMSLIGGGIPLFGVYAFLYIGIDSDGQTLEAIGVAREYGVKRVWLDVEATGENERAGMTPTGRVTEVARCVQLVRSAGMEPGIYTGRWYWVPKMANSQAFKDLPLWHSAYYPDRHTEQAVDYGGWTQCAIHQYASDIELCGRVRDHNYVFEGDDMTPEEVNQLIESFMGTNFPVYLRAALEEVPGKFSDRPDIPMTFPYRPWLDDINRAVHTVVLPQVTSEGGIP